VSSHDVLISPEQRQEDTGFAFGLQLGAMNSVRQVLGLRTAAKGITM
jgi:hypothetical protein